LPLLEELRKKANEESKYPSDQEFLERKAIDVVYEMLKAKELLEKGDTRNAAGKAFQAWKDLLSCLIYLNLDKLARNEKEKEWYVKSGILVPTSKMRRLAQRLEEIGVEKTSFITDKALSLHSYQYNGPDPDGVWFGPRDEEEAREDVKLLLKATKEYLEKYVIPHIKGKSLELIRKALKIIL
jgi:HEPN domain-containing protein